MNIRTCIWTASIGATALVAALIFSGCTKTGKLDMQGLGAVIGGPTGQLIQATGHELNVASLSEKDENSLGESVGVTLISRYGVYHNDQALTYVTLVGMTVANSSPNPGGNYVFGILDTNEVNAYSGPNGYIFVTRGLLANLHDEAELAGVLGHEIAHCCHHDGLDQMKASEQQAAISSAVQAADKNHEFSQVADLTIDAITKTGYSQPQEFNADEDGVKYMSAAGYDARSYLAFLQRLQQLEAGGSGTVMSTHPAVNERVTRVTNEIATLNLNGGATLPDRFASSLTLPRF